MSSTHYTIILGGIPFSYLSCCPEIRTSRASPLPTPKATWVTYIHIFRTKSRLQFLVSATDVSRRFWRHSRMFNNRKPIRFELRLDRSCIFIPVFPEDQATNMPSISGKLFLYIPLDISVKAIEVKIVGSLKIPRPEIIAGPCQGGTTVERSQTLASSRDNSFRLPRGRYEFPFELPLAREMMDTVTGVGHEYHSYEVRGVVHRHFYSDIESSSPLRIHRTPNVFYANLLDQVVPSVEEHLNERLNLRYRISIPMHIPFGASFPLQVEYSSLSDQPQKGQSRSDIHPRSITIHITETHALKVTPTASDAINYNNPLPLIFRKEHVILHQSYTVQPPARALLPESLDFDYSSTIPVHLPQDFHACTQDVQSELIKVHHNLRYNVEFGREREDETESSQQNKFTGTIPFGIYMSPCTVMHHDVVYQQNLQELERELGIGHGEPLPPYRQREHSHPHHLSGSPPT